MQAPKLQQRKAYKKSVQESHVDKKAMWARKPWGNKGPVGEKAMWTRKPCGQESPVGKKAMWARKKRIFGFTRGGNLNFMVHAGRTFLFISQFTQSLHGKSAPPRNAEAEPSA